MKSARRCWRQDVRSIVGSDGWRCLSECVGQAHRVRLGHQRRQLVRAEPRQATTLGAGSRLSADDPAAKHERDDRSPHVLVHAGERLRLDSKPGLFLYLAHEAVGNRLSKLKDASWRLPASIVRALDHEETVSVVNDGGRDADRMECRCDLAGR